VKDEKYVGTHKRECALNFRGHIQEWESKEIGSHV
jgi:hypothetical protein